MKPTNKKDWVAVGDKVVANGQSMRGVVVRIVERQHGLHTVVVEWESGSTGRHTISTLRRLDAPPDSK